MAPALDEDPPSTRPFSLKETSTLDKRFQRSMSTCWGRLAIALLVHADSCSGIYVIVDFLPIVHLDFRIFRHPTKSPHGNTRIFFPFPRTPPPACL